MDTQLEYLAKTLIGEARGEPVQGIIGVGCVIRNRVITLKKSYKEVVTALDYSSTIFHQFDCWDVNGPNYAYITGLNLDNPPDKYCKQALWVAQGIFDGSILDNTGGAKNYVTIARYQLATGRKGSLDQWILKMKIAVTLGSQIFLKDSNGPAPTKA